MRVNNLNDPMQSAYLKHHSTETALVKVQNDIMKAVDSGSGVILVMLDLSAAFDKVDHEILLRRLEKRLGVKGTVLQWFRSYLSGRTQRVYVNGTTSDSHPFKYGVPQGSVMGPKCFRVYTLPVGDIARLLGLNYQIYADDNDLYIVFKPP
jgi:hypothetical protein